MTTPQILPHRSLVTRLLDDDTCHIEFNGFLTNHAKHAVVALAGLDTPDERIAQYYRGYVERTPYGFGLEPARPATVTITAASWESELGARRDFEALRQYFAARVQAVGLERVLADHMPRLMLGCAGALLHGTIHLGWALDAGHHAMIVEGLAYMAFTHVSSHPERDRGTVPDDSVWASILRFADAWRDQELSAWLDELTADPALSPASGFAPQLAGTGLQLRIAQVLERGHALLQNTPRWLLAAPLPSIWAQLHEAAALVYLSEPGDFVLLHVITGLHALEQICTRLAIAQRRAALRHGWRALVSVLLARGGLRSRASLEAIRVRHGEARDADDTGWGPVVARALEEVEEHNIKLVYVLRRQWRVQAHRALFRHAAAEFITTPVIQRFTADDPERSAYL